MTDLPDSCYDYRYEAPKAKAITKCDICGDAIYEGDSYFKIKDLTVCNDCINTFKTIAREE